MPLKEYRHKRNFQATTEPKGRARRASRDHIFVVQKHDASRLHCDFRLEANRVLLSWAVPKGPTLDPGSKRFATMTKDHLLEYTDFEGVIPEGEYGAGTVMVWDKGKYETTEDMPVERQLARGELKLVLHGKKLRGEFVLVRMGRRKGKPKEKSRWLLIKRRDQSARRSWSPETRSRSTSVLTGRTLRQIEKRGKRRAAQPRAKEKDPMG